MRQLVPSEYTGTLLAPPPATIEAKVVALASVTNARAPEPAVAAEAKPATVDSPRLIHLAPAFNEIPGTRSFVMFVSPIVISLDTVADDDKALYP